MSVKDTRRMKESEISWETVRLSPLPFYPPLYFRGVSVLLMAFPYHAVGTRWTIQRRNHVISGLALQCPWGNICNFLLSLHPAIKNLMMTHTSSEAKQSVQATSSWVVKNPNFSKVIPTSSQLVQSEAGHRQLWCMAPFCRNIGKGFWPGVMARMWSMLFEKLIGSENRSLEFALKAEMEAGRIS